MTIATFDDYMNAKRQTVRVIKFLASPTSPDCWASMPTTAASGNLGQMPNPSNTTTGLVPVAGDTGFPSIESFNGARGFLTRIQNAIEIGPATNAGRGVRLLLCDRLWHGGQFTSGSVPYTLSAPPDFSGRLPGGNYAGTMLWLEQTGNASGSQSISLTYTNAAGTSGRTSSRSSFGPLTATSAALMPLQSGDVGIRAVTSINSSTNNNTFYLTIVRPLATWRLHYPVPDLALEMEALMQEVYDTSALMLFAYQETSDTPNGPVFDIDFEIASA